MFLQMEWLFVYLFIAVVPSRISHSYGDFTITGEGPQLQTCAKCLRSLYTEESLANHIGAVILTSVAVRLAVTLSLPVLTTLRRGWDRNIM